jgi:hypothetical protein
VPRYKLTIAYDGTDFCGWQKQFPHADAVPGALTQFRDDDPPQLDAPDHNSATPAHDTDGDPSRPRAELRTVQSVVERAVRMVVRQPTPEGRSAPSPPQTMRHPLLLRATLRG